MESVAPASPTRVPRAGEVFAGAYRVESVLGKGGMGIVVAAEHVSLRRPVAVKFLLPQAMQSPSASARFLREARAVARMQSEHIVRIIDYGVSEGGLPFMVMERLSGSDLQAVLNARGPLPVDEAVAYVLQACAAIAEAHGKGIVHRDLKPENLFLTFDADGQPLVKVLDFGVSKAFGKEPEVHEGALTSAAMVLGSPRYMSPEQVRSARSVDHRTDLWSLGVILYQLLTGRFPFEEPNAMSLFVSIAMDPPVPPRAHRPDLPAALDAVILRCLEKCVSRRVPSIADLALALAPFASGRARHTADRVARIGRRRPPPVLRVVRRSEDGDAQAPEVQASPLEKRSAHPPAPAQGRVPPPAQPRERERPSAHPGDEPTLVSRLANVAPAPSPKSSRPPATRGGPAREPGAHAVSSLSSWRRGVTALLAVAAAVSVATALVGTLRPARALTAVSGLSAALPAAPPQPAARTEPAVVTRPAGTQARSPQAAELPQPASQESAKPPSATGGAVRSGGRVTNAPESIHTTETTATVPSEDIYDSR